MVQTLNSLDALKESGFGLPRPRHGLQLLYWFARKYIVFDMNNEMEVKCHPERGDFGFHLFQNRLECDDYSCITLLPEGKYPYYEVGNLHLSKSISLPPYVKKNYTGRQDISNMDRIIISMRQGQQVDKVYVTQHDDPKNFDHENTFRISRGLLRSICKITVPDDFLREAGYFTPNHHESPSHQEFNDFVVNFPSEPAPSEPAPPMLNDVVVNLPSEPAPPIRPQEQQFRKIQYPESKTFWDYCTIL